MKTSEKDKIKAMTFEREKEIKCLKHDEIVMQLLRLDLKQILVLLNLKKDFASYSLTLQKQREVGGFYRQVQYFDINELTEREKNLIEINKNGIFRCNKNKICEVERIAEYVVRGGYNNQNILGFIDISLFIEINPPESIEFLDNNEKYRFYFRTNQQKYTRINFEVKSKEPNFGEIVREINFYRSNCDGIYVLVAPSCSYKDLLKKQNILFLSFDEIKYPSVKTEDFTHKKD